MSRRRQSPRRRPASRVATLTTLGLGQYRIDLIGERVALDLEANGSESEQGTIGDGHTHEGSQREKNGITKDDVEHQTSPAKPMKASDANPAVIIPMAAP